MSATRRWWNKQGFGVNTTRHPRPDSRADIRRHLEEAKPEQYIRRVVATPLGLAVQEPER
jgi:hypothetical protein